VPRGQSRMAHWSRRLGITPAWVAAATAAPCPSHNTSPRWPWPVRRAALSPPPAAQTRGRLAVAGSARALAAGRATAPRPRRCCSVCTSRVVWTSCGASVSVCHVVVNQAPNLLRWILMRQGHRGDGPGQADAQGRARACRDLCSPVSGI